MTLGDNSSAESGSISRRTIVKGAAWAAPVMIAAVAVPAAVASPNILTTLTITDPLPAGNVKKGTTPVTVKLSVQPSTYVGTVYLTLASTDPGQKFEFTNAAGVVSPTPTVATFSGSNGTVYIKTPSGNGKTATLSASSSATQPTTYLVKTLTTVN